MAIDIARLKSFARPKGLPFSIGKIGHVVLHVSDIERSTRFYVEVLGFQISDVYPEDMVAGGMVFMRFSPDHHGVALIGTLKEKSKSGELNHMAFEVGTLDEVLRARDHLKHHGIEPHFEGRRRAGCQIAVEFQDPDGHQLEIYWGLDQVGSDGHVRPASEWKGAQSIAEAIADPVRGQDTTLFDSKLAAR
jgi:catechol 2,3-dioxygenase